LNPLPFRCLPVHTAWLMALLGKRNSLLVLRQAPPGFYLDGGSYGEILLPGKYVPKGAVPGDTLEVFVYRDSEDRLVATTETPLVTVGEFAYLRVVGGLPKVGAFLDWGLEKDLLLPNREQAGRLSRDDRVVVRVYVDDRSDRIVASARFDKWLRLTRPTYAEGEAVQLLIEAETPLGYTAIVNHTHRGLLYHSDLRAALPIGQWMTGYVREIRADDKIDLTLDKAGYGRIKPLTTLIEEKLAEGGGRLAFHDGSSPEAIREAFGVSKKAFKQALGALYRGKKIVLEDGGIRVAPVGADKKDAVTKNANDAFKGAGQRKR
jgi:predicted RNA-binding protein (virulence factor B family)